MKCKRYRPQNQYKSYLTEHNNSKVVVIDSGSNSVKLGYSGELRQKVDNSGALKPQFVLPAYVSIQKDQRKDNNFKPDKELHRHYGDLSYVQLEKIKDFDIFPLNQYGNIIANVEDKSGNDNWDRLVYFWEEACKEKLDITLKDKDVVLVNAPHYNADYKKEIEKRCFEDLNVKSLNMMDSASLSLFSTGATRGFVVETGHTLTTTVPIYEGYLLKYAMNQQPIGGDIITKYLVKVLLPKISLIYFQIKELMKKGIKIYKNKFLYYEEVQRMKNKFADVAENYEDKISGGEWLEITDKQFTLPNGEMIDVRHELRLNSGELLFDPSITGQQFDPIQDQIQDSINKTAKEFQNDLYKHIFVCGGTSTMKGFNKRIYAEIADSSALIKEIPELPLKSFQKYSAWIGGSMMSQLSTFTQFAVTKNDYFEIDEFEEEKEEKYEKR